jgi:hypothetical protein
MELKSLILSIVVIAICCSNIHNNVNAKKEEDNTNIAILDLHRLRRKLLLINTDTKSTKNHRQLDTISRSTSTTTTTSKKVVQSDYSSSSHTTNKLSTAASSQNNHQQKNDFLSSNERLLDTSEMIWDLTQDRNRFLLSLSISMSM